MRHNIIISLLIIVFFVPVRINCSDSDGLNNLYYPYSLSISFNYPFLLSPTQLTSNPNHIYFSNADSSFLNGIDALGIKYMTGISGGLSFNPTIDLSLGLNAVYNKSNNINYSCDNCTSSGSISAKYSYLGGNFFVRYYLGIGKLKTFLQPDLSLSVATAFSEKKYENKISQVEEKNFLAGLGLFFGIEYSFQPFITSYFSVGLQSANLFYGEISSDISEKMFSITPKLGFRYHFGAKRCYPIIKVTNQNGDENIVKIKKLIKKKFAYYPILKTVFFDSISSTAIPDRYIKLKKNEVNDFNPDSLIITDLLSQYYQVLNIIAYILTNEHHNVRLISICYSDLSKTNRQLIAEARAQTLIDYFANIWGIEKNRFEIITNINIPRNLKSNPNYSEDEYNRIDIELSNSHNLYLKGPESEEEEIEYPLPQLLFQSNFCDLKDGITSREISIYSNKRTILKTTLDNFNKVVLPETITDLKDRETLSYKYQATHQTVRIADVKGKLTVKVKPRTENCPEIYVLFNNGSNELIDTVELYKLLLKKIGNIMNFRKLNFYGYNYDKEIRDNDSDTLDLSLMRAKRMKDLFVAKFMISKGKLENIHVTSFGSTPIEKMNFNLPEARFYNRAVKIEIIN